MNKVARLQSLKTKNTTKTQTVIAINVTPLVFTITKTTQTLKDSLSRSTLNDF